LLVDSIGEAICAKEEMAIQGEGDQGGKSVKDRLKAGVRVFKVFCDNKTKK